MENGLVNYYDTTFIYELSLFRSFFYMCEYKSRLQARQIKERINEPHLTLSYEKE